MSKEPTPAYWRAYAAANGLLPAMTHDEAVEFECQKAKEMARAEERRKPTPQLDLAA